MASDFSGRMQEIIDRVGDGKLVGRVVVDQVYAKYQHERLDLKHPSGGEAKYLEKALLATKNTGMQRLASATLRGQLIPAMIANVEDIADEVFRRAPFEFGDLKASAAPEVRDQGRWVYRRPPMRKRLSKQELRIKSRLRNIGLGNRGL